MNETLKVLYESLLTKKHVRWVVVNQTPLTLEGSYYIGGAKIRQELDLVSERILCYHYPDDWIYVKLTGYALKL